MSKRFTDAELAAEYWCVTGEVITAVERCYPHYNENSYYWLQVIEAEERQIVIERFAVLPSAV